MASAAQRLRKLLSLPHAVQIREQNMGDDSRAVDKVLIRTTGTYGKSIRILAKYFLHVNFLTEFGPQIREAGILHSSLSLQTTRLNLR